MGCQARPSEHSRLGYDPRSRTVSSVHRRDAEAQRGPSGNARSPAAAPGPKRVRAGLPVLPDLLDQRGDVQRTPTTRGGYLAVLLSERPPGSPTGAFRPHCSPGASGAQNLLHQVRELPFESDANLTACPLTGRETRATGSQVLENQVWSHDGVHVSMPITAGHSP